VKLHFIGFIWSFLNAIAATREINQVNPVHLFRKHIGAPNNKGAREWITSSACGVVVVFIAQPPA